MNEKRVLAIGAHPDDIEFGMAGTLLLLAAHGYSPHYMTMANGSCGSNVMDAAQTIETRGAESRVAAASLGAKYHPPLTDDLEVFYNSELLSRTISVIRDIAPEILLVPSLFDYMEDHTMTARLAVMAAFCRSMPNARCEPARPAISGPIVVYHAQPHGHRDSMGLFRRPDFLVGVDSVMERKSCALAAHKSQRDWLDETQGMCAYLKAMEDLCAEMGLLGCGKFTFAEGWSRHNHLGFCDASSDPICETLRDSVFSLEDQNQ